MSITTAAWCYTLARGRGRGVFVNLFGYDLWAYLTIILLMGLFFSVVCYACTVVRLARGIAIVK